MNLLENDTIEQPINQYKFFYKKYLSNTKNRKLILNELQGINEKFRKIEPKSALLKDLDREKLEYRVETFLQENFNKELVRLYNKKLPKPIQNNNYISDENSFWLNLLGAFVQTFENLNESYKQEINYKKNFLNFLFSCYSMYGLHPNILKRNPIIDKKFNLVIDHFYRSKNKTTEFKIMMSYESFDREFISLYMKQKPIRMKGKLIPFIDIYEVKITTTLLKEDEISLFALKNNFIWNETEKDVFSFINSCIDETETYHPNPFDERTYDKNINVLLIEETKQWLVSYPKSFKLYNSAVKKYEIKNFERNVLDDMRLSLELLLKDLLGNSKSLEKQLPELGTYQKNRGASNEVTNMFQKLIDYYSKYQNNYIKHNDNVQESEMSFVIDLTTTFMRYILKKK